VQLGLQWVFKLLNEQWYQFYFATHSINPLISAPIEENIWRVSRKKDPTNFVYNNRRGMRIACETFMTLGGQWESGFVAPAANQRPPRGPQRRRKNIFLPFPNPQTSLPITGTSQYTLLPHHLLVVTVHHLPTCIADFGVCPVVPAKIHLCN